MLQFRRDFSSYESIFDLNGGKKLKLSHLIENGCCEGEWNNILNIYVYGYNLCFSLSCDKNFPASLNNFLLFTETFNKLTQKTFIIIHYGRIYGIPDIALYIYSNHCTLIESRLSSFVVDFCFSSKNFCCPALSYTIKMYPKQFTGTKLCRCALHLLISTRMNYGEGLVKLCLVIFRMLATITCLRFVAVFCITVRVRQTQHWTTIRVFLRTFLLHVTTLFISTLFLHYLTIISNIFTHYLLEKCENLTWMWMLALNIVHLTIRIGTSQLTLWICINSLYFEMHIERIALLNSNILIYI